MVGVRIEQPLGLDTRMPAQFFPLLWDTPIELVLVLVGVAFSSQGVVRNYQPRSVRLCKSRATNMGLHGVGVEAASVCMVASTTTLPGRSWVTPMLLCLGTRQPLQSHDPMLLFTETNTFYTFAIKNILKCKKKLPRSRTALMKRSETGGILSL